MEQNKEKTMTASTKEKVAAKPLGKPLDRYVFIENVDMEFRSKKGVFKALENINLNINKVSLYRLLATLVAVNQPCLT